MRHRKIMSFLEVAPDTTASLNPEYEARSLDTMCLNESRLSHKWYHNLKYTAVGIVFGLAFVKSEVISWFRIQEMFRLQSYHLYAILGTAVIIATVSVLVIQRFRVKTIYGEQIEFHTKKFNKGQILGGIIFGFGWAMTGACPGPMFAQLGTGAMGAAVMLLSAIAGTWLYGRFRDRLPH